MRVRLACYHYTQGGGPGLGLGLRCTEEADSCCVFLVSDALDPSDWEPRRWESERPRTRCGPWLHRDSPNADALLEGSLNANFINRTSSDISQVYLEG